MEPTAKCRSCGATIIWARHATTGNLAPLDAAPSPIGTILIKNGVYSVPDAQGRLLNPDALHTNHYATCPETAQWSRRQARQ
jgi:hypothetical protein